MRRIAPLFLAVALLVLAAIAMAVRPETGRSATEQGTPQAGFCASPVADGIASPAAGTTADPANSPEVLPPDGLCGATPRADPAASNQIEIALSEFAFTPNEITIPADTDVTFVLTNVGSTSHDFNIDSAFNPSDPGIHSGNVNAGESTIVTINLPAGDWFLYCSIMGHYDLDMVGTIHAR